MSSVQQETVYVFLLDAVDHTYKWFEAQTPVVTLASFVLGTTIPRRRLADIKLASAAFIILDSNGYYIKKPAPAVIGSSTRVYSDAVEWLQNNAIYMRQPELHLAYTDYTPKHVQSNPPFESQKYLEFVPFTLPIGLPTNF